MISRRLLRVKALLALYAFNRRDDNDLVQAEKELMFSISRTYDLYHLVLLLVIDLADIAREKIDLALRKKMPTREDLNPNRRFADNTVINQLRENSDLNSFVSSKKLSWANSQEVAKAIYNKMIAWDTYIEYMKSPKSSYPADKKFIVSLVTDFLVSSDDLITGLEEQSIFWNDDLDYVGAMIEKTLRKFKSEEISESRLMPLYKSDDDERFVKTLFRKAVLGSKDCSDMIDRNTTNWEIERIALMDILVMQLAITEIVEFQEIPVKVTLNEYIEIAKYYCTSKSSTFVNGILDKVVREMRDNGKFKKTGRGLVGDLEKDDE
ncbi:MAG TPA: transcription antitermination factor NusB [Bacteroidales bacterium]|nr:transcription antitermination factor NusB [Bacteroidales bacterium]